MSNTTAASKTSDLDGKIEVFHTARAAIYARRTAPSPGTIAVERASLDARLAALREAQDASVALLRLQFLQAKARS